MIILPKIYTYTVYACIYIYIYMAVCQNLVPLVNIKIAGKWMLIPLKMVLIGIDPYPYNIIISAISWGEWSNGPFVEVFHSLRLPFVGSATRGAPERCVFGAASAPRGAAHGAERGRRQGTWGDFFERLNIA